MKPSRCLKRKGDIESTFAQISAKYLVSISVEDHRDYHHGYMVPSRISEHFALVHRKDGFILQYPRRKTPLELFPMPENDKLIDVFRQYGGWLASLDIDNVGALNEAVESGKVKRNCDGFRSTARTECFSYRNKNRPTKEKVKVVLISGPSSSGKTTFSKRLSIQLLAHGISPFPLEMDNYFVDRDKTPRDESGAFNFSLLKR